MHLLAPAEGQNAPALSHDQARTLFTLRDEIRAGEMHSCRGIDPYASMTRLYPRIICAPSNETLFDPANAPASGFYADAQDAADQPITEEAIQRLGEVWGQQTWERLAPFTRESLAQAEVLFRDDRYGLVRRDDVDPASVLLHLARALERELVTETLGPLVKAARSPSAGSKPMATLRFAASLARSRWLSRRWAGARRGPARRDPRRRSRGVRASAGAAGSSRARGVGSPRSGPVKSDPCP